MPTKSRQSCTVQGKAEGVLVAPPARDVDAQVKAAFHRLAHSKKRTPLVHELVGYFERRRLGDVAAAVEETLQRLGLPAITPSRLQVFYDRCRVAKGLGVGDRLSIEAFSEYLRSNYEIQFGKSALKNWNGWGEGTAQPLFKLRARDKDQRSKIRVAIEEEYHAIERQLREQKILSRRPRFVELAYRISRKFGEFSFGESGVRHLVREVNRERVRSGKDPIPFHQGRTAFTDKVERAHWQFIEKNRRAPTYHELAAQFSGEGGKPCNWQIIRGAYRRINAYRTEGAPKLETQITQGLYDAEILDAHRRIDREGRPPTMRALERAIKEARPEGDFSFGYMRKRVHALRRSGESLPTRAYEITSVMVKLAYEKLFCLFQSPPTLNELRQQILRSNPDVEDISKDAIQLHVHSLRAQASKGSSPSKQKHRFELARLSGFDRLSMIRRLVVPTSGALVIRESNLMDRSENPEKKAEKPAVFWLKNSPSGRAFLKLVNGTAPHSGLSGVTEGQRAFLRAKEMWGDGLARAATTTPLCERLAKGTPQHAPFAAREWRALVSFALKHVVPHAGIASSRVAELEDVFDGSLVRLDKTGRDLRLVMEPSIRLHSRSRQQYEGAVSNLELLDFALRRAFAGIWRGV
jgi:hypothetical protein